MQQSVIELPFNSFIGLERAIEPERLLRLPSGERYLNHHGTVHASALLALAEATSGEYLLRHIGMSDGIIPVVRRLESKFRKPARGCVTSTASATPGAMEQLKGELYTRGRALIPITVELHDEAGTHVLSASVEWFIQRNLSPLGSIAS